MSKKSLSLRRFLIAGVVVIVLLLAAETLAFISWLAFHYYSTGQLSFAGQSGEEAAAFFRESNRQLLLVGGTVSFVWLLVLLSLLLLFGVICVRWIVRPVTEVNKAAARIAEGDYETRIPLPKVRNEVSRLGREINNMAEKLAFAERTKLDFISTISHELRTPLTAIKGWGETLRHGTPDSDLLHRGLGVMIDESVRLDNLVEELLDFSRLQGKGLELSREPIDALAELDEVVYLFCERAARSGVELRCNTSEVPAPMMGDPARVRQIFINLLDNALKHTPQGGSVTVASGFTPELPKDRPPAAPPETLHITISDTGCGVSGEDLPHITEKFFKASASTKGSGIGLAVVEDLMRSHGGTLEFESLEGEGLTVFMTFPLLKK